MVGGDTPAKIYDMEESKDLETPAALKPSEEEGEDINDRKSIENESPL